MDIGKPLFSFTIEETLPNKDFLSIGRAVRYRNSRKIMVFVMLAVFVTFFLSMFITPLFALLLVAIAFQVALFMEYSSRDIANNVKKLTPIQYDFYEDALIETIKGESKTLMYSKFNHVKMNAKVFTLVSKEDKDVIVIPRSLIDRDAEILLMKLQRIIGA